MSRIQLICAFIIAGLHVNPTEFKNKPPLNPILGETHTAELDDGTKIWLEQTCHHPPITSWYMVGPSDLYTFYGHGQIIAGLSGANTIKAGKKGKHIIVFHNGDVIEYQAPDMRISGVILGQRNVNFYGSFEINDLKNKLAMRVTFEQDQGMIGSIAGTLGGFLTGKKKELPSDFFKAKIFRYNDDNDEKEEICQGTGSWLEYVRFGGQMLWSINMKPGEMWRVSSDHLPSDSVYRPDLVCLLNGDVERAQVKKDEIENLQRRDRTLRTDS